MSLAAAVQETAPTSPLAGAVFALGLAAVHVLGGRTWDVDRERMRRILSVGSGAAVAYVFVLILPEISEAAHVVGQERGDAFLAEQEVYLVALLGFVTFYGIEVYAARRPAENGEAATIGFWEHMLAFAIYSAIIGYLLFHQELFGVTNLFFYAVAMALHFAVTDFEFHVRYGRAFARVGRWVLVGGTLLGAVVGALTELGGLPLAMLFGFVAGGIVMNVLKEELPAADQIRFLGFAGGAGVYTVILVLT